MTWQSVRYVIGKLEHRKSFQLLQQNRFAYTSIRRKAYIWGGNTSFFPPSMILPGYTTLIVALSPSPGVTCASFAMMPSSSWRSVWQEQNISFHENKPLTFHRIQLKIPPGWTGKVDFLVSLRAWIFDLASKFWPSRPALAFSFCTFPSRFYIETAMTQRANLEFIGLRISVTDGVHRVASYSRNPTEQLMCTFFSTSTAGTICLCFKGR